MVVGVDNAYIKQKSKSHRKNNSNNPSNSCLWLADKMGNLWPLFHLFLVFFQQKSLLFLQQINVKKSPSSTQC